MDEDPEGYAITTSHLPDTSEVQDCPSCSSPVIWIILFIVFLLLAIGLGIWLIYLIRREKNCSGCTGCTGPGIPISFENPIINVDSPNQITGSWTTTDPGVSVTLFATLHPPKFDSNGALLNSSASTNFKTSSPISIGVTGITGATGITGTVNSVSLSNLTAGVKYYATLVARNGSTNNYKSYTQIVYMQDGNIPTGPTGNFNTFEIQDILQVGAIQLTSDVPDASGNYNVEFNQRPRQARDLFYFNGKSQLQLDPNNTLGLNNLCLFNNAGNVVAADCGGFTGAASGSTPNNSYFTYNPKNHANMFCLKNTLDTATPTCLKLTGIGSGTGTLSLTNVLTSGDAWAPAFVNTQ